MRSFVVKSFVAVNGYSERKPETPTENAAAILETFAALGEAEEADGAYRIVGELES